MNKRAIAAELKDIKSRLWNYKYGRVCFKVNVGGEDKVVLNAEDVSDYLDDVFNAAIAKERKEIIAIIENKLLPYTEFANNGVDGALKIVIEKIKERGLK